jgi:hypothetical protein
MGHEGAARWAVVAACVVGALLRLYPLGARYLHPDQELIPSLALAAFARGDWYPGFFQYPSGFTYLLRLSYTTGYGVLRVLGGAFNDRMDFVTSFVADPFPFLLVARLWACLFGIVTIPLAARLGAQLFGPCVGALGAMLLATAFLAVRESHYGTMDAPATAAFIATLVTVVAYVDAPRRRTLVGAAVLAGVAAALRYQTGLVCMALPAAAVLAPGSRSGRATDLILATLASLVVFAVFSPYTVTRPDMVWSALRVQIDLAWGSPQGLPAGLPLLTSLAVAVGLLCCVSAVVGMIVALRTHARATVTILVVALPYGLALFTSHLSFVRYTLPLVPLLCVFAAGGLHSVATVLPARVRRPALLLFAIVTLWDPTVRSLQLDRLLATEDTRVAAGRWLSAHLPATAPVLLPTYKGYANPMWGTALALPSWPIESGLREEAERRLAGSHPPFLGLDGLGVAEDLRRHGGIVVTADHGGPAFWATTPAPIAALLEERKAFTVELARFTGTDEAAVDAGVLYEPIDANFVPLRGFGRIRAPGPNIVVRRLFPEQPTTSKK